MSDFSDDDHSRVPTRSSASLVPICRREPWYRNATFLTVLKSTAINLILPFFNGVMLGFGEILANELVFKYGWFGHARVFNPSTASVGIRSGHVPLTGTASYKKVLMNQQNDIPASS